MKCPKCKTEDLKPTKLEQGLSAMGCGQCHGALVSLLYYRDWVERHEPVMPAGKVAAEQAADSEAAMTCPKCSRLMTKYRISGCNNHRLDLCASCDEAWLDGGEWELLKSLELSRLMPLVFTEEWQRKLRKELFAADREARLRKVVSEADVEQAKTMRRWLKDHPHRAEILFFINHE